MQNSDYIGAMLFIQMLNKCLDKNHAIKIGHGIDKKTVGLAEKNDMSKVRLLEIGCPLCINSLDICDIHPPPESGSGQDRLHAMSIESAWITDFATLVQVGMTAEGKAKGWWQE